MIVNSFQGGTLVTSHCNTDEGARNAIEGGIGGIEHGGLLSDDTLKLMAKKGIHYTPTLIIQDVSHSPSKIWFIRQLICIVHRQWAFGSTGAEVLARKGKAHRQELVQSCQEGS
jgi:hypothetical protein